MAAMREAVGDEVDIMVDFHGRTTPAMAIEYGQVLAAIPASSSSRSRCPPENVDALAEVREAVAGADRDRRAAGDALPVPRAL